LQDAALLLLSASCFQAAAGTPGCFTFMLGTEPPTRSVLRFFFESVLLHKLARLASAGHVSTQAATPFSVQRKLKQQMLLLLLPLSAPCPKHT
jgi:hypothetical protein